MLKQDFGDEYDSVERTRGILATAAANQNDKTDKEVIIKKNILFSSSI